MKFQTLVALSCVLGGAAVLAQSESKVINLMPNAPPVSRPPPLFQPGQSLAPMARATIFVRDIDESLKLYRDILGLKPMFDNRWSGQGINAIMGTKDKELRATVLMAGDSTVGNIGIYQLYNEKGHATPAAQGHRYPDRRRGRDLPHQRHP